MSVLLGADPARVDVIADGLRRYSQDLQDLRTRAQRAVFEMRNAWCGPDFEVIAQRWEQEAGPRLVDVSAALSTMAVALLTQAAEQHQTSGNTGGSSDPGKGGTPGGLPPGGGGDASSGGGEQKKIEDLDPDDVDVLLPMVSEKDSNSGNRTHTSSSVFINGHKVGGGEDLRIDVIGQSVPEATLVNEVKDNVRLNLAEGQVDVRASLVSRDGGNDNFQYELSAGEAEAKAEYSADVDAHGNLVASAGVSAAAYAGYAAGKVQGGNDFAKVGAGSKAYVGAEVKADTSGSIGRDGAKGHLGAEAFAGGKAEIDASGTVAGVTATAGAEISYGIGAHAAVDAGLSTTNVGVAVDIGATLGVGAGVKFDASVNPQEVIANIGHAVDEIGDAAETSAMH